MATRTIERNHLVVHGGEKPLKLGVLTDMSGVYSDFSGAGSVTAVNMAVADLGGKVLDRTIEVSSADHQNKADVGSSIAREWYDKEGVDAILDTTNFAVTLAVMAITNEKNRIIMIGDRARQKPPRRTAHQIAYSMSTMRMRLPTSPVRH